MKLAIERVISYWVFAEVFLCFSSIAISLLVSSLFTIPIGIMAVFSFQLGFSALLIITLLGWCGLCGIVALAIRIFEKDNTEKPSMLIFLGVLVGIIALCINQMLSGVHDIGGQIQYFWLPLIASLHLLWVGRQYLFGQAANKKRNEVDGYGEPPIR